MNFTYLDVNWPGPFLIQGRFSSSESFSIFSWWLMESNSLTFFSRLSKFCYSWVFSAIKFRVVEGTLRYIHCPPLLLLFFCTWINIYLNSSSQSKLVKHNVFTFTLNNFDILDDHGTVPALWIGKAFIVTINFIL